MHSHPARRFALTLTLTGIAVLGAWPTPLAAQTPAARANSAPLPGTKADAEKWLRERGQGSGADSLAFYLGLASNWSADVVRMMLLSGASATNPDLTGDYPLSALGISCDGQAAAAEIGEVLLQAGASVDVVESNGRKATPAMAAVMCPALLKVILAKKPNLNAVDALSCGNRNLVSRVVAYSLASRCTHPSIGMTKYSPRQEDRCIKRSTEQNP